MVGYSHVFWRSAVNEAVGKGDTRVLSLSCGNSHFLWVLFREELLVVYRVARIMPFRHMDEIFVGWALGKLLFKHFMDKEFLNLMLSLGEDSVVSRQEHPRWWILRSWRRSISTWESASGHGELPQRNPEHQSFQLPREECVWLCYISLSLSPGMKKTTIFELVKGFVYLNCFIECTFVNYN